MCIRDRIAGGEIKLLVVQGIVRDVHLAIEAAERAVSVNDGGGVMVDAGRASFENGDNDDDSLLAGHSRHRIAGRSGNGFGKIEEGSLFPLAEILGAEQLGKTDDLRTLARRLANSAQGALQVLLRIRRTPQLQKTYLEFFRWQWRLEDSAPSIPNPLCTVDGGSDEAVA